MTAHGCERNVGDVGVGVLHRGADNRVVRAREAQRMLVIDPIVDEPGQRGSKNASATGSLSAR